MVSHNIGLCQELLEYFSLFLIQFCKEGRLSGKKDRRGAGSLRWYRLVGASAQPGDEGLPLRGRLHSPQGELPVCGPYYDSWLLDWTSVLGG